MIGARVLAAATAAAAAAMPLPAAAPAKARDWSQVVVATPQGGMRMGNPNARVRLVEYGSLACPHCREFEQTGFKPLVQNYVRSGRVSYEFRNLLLNAPDISASVLAHCAGPSKFFPMVAAVFDAQPEWFDRIGGLSEDQKSALAAMPEGERVASIGRLAGFPKIAARFGVSPQRARQCLADPKRIERLLSVTKAARESGIVGTPTFFINGARSDAATWPQLEPQLKRAAGG